MTRLLRLLLPVLILSFALPAAATTQTTKQGRIKYSLQMAGMPRAHAARVQTGLANVFYYDTAVELLAATPAEGVIGYAIDTNAFYLYEGASWAAFGSTQGGTAFTGAATSASQTLGIPFNSMRVHDNLAALLPVAAASDDAGNVPGTVGTTAPSLQSVDFGGASADEKGTFSFVMPASYPAGATLTLRANAGMLTTISDATATLDFECWVPDYANADGTVSSDLVTTAATTINSTTFADTDFVVDDDVSGHELAPGSVLQCRLSFAGTDAGDAGAGITGVIRQLSLLVST